MLHRPTFPSAGADSGTVEAGDSTPAEPGWGIYSYGDSAGFSPDFPFNDASVNPIGREDRIFGLGMVIDTQKV